MPENDSNLYTTGEIAKLCGVSVRTVQYYDSRGILVPSELSEGGRRLYSDSDVKKLKIICFLRETGLSINSIGELLSEDDFESVMSILLDQQEKELKGELATLQRKLDTVEYIKQEMKNIDDFSVESIGDIAHIMQNRKKMRQIRITFLTIGLIGELVEAVSLFFWIFKGIWWPFVFVGLPMVLACSAYVMLLYFKKVSFICPKCHTVFKPRYMEMLFANHTLTTRKLTCTNCLKKGFCVEVYEEEKENG